MKFKSFYWIILAIGLVFSGYLYKKYRIAPKLNLSELQLSDLSGNEFSLDEIEADLIILNFWASWCGPCRQELPVLSEVMKKFSSENIAVIMISDEKLPLINRFLANKNYTMEFYKMDKKLQELNIHTIPTTYFLDAEKNVIKTKVNGINWHSDELLAWINSFN